MKLRICCLFALVLMLTLGASASQMVNEEYTDVTSVMTQDAVISVELFSEEPEEELHLNLQQPDEKSMALLEKIYDFVWREKNRPVRYYDEETQQKIQELVPGTDIDALYLTEFMAQDMHGIPTEDVVIERLLDVDYQPGQLVVVVLGYEQENGEYLWLPYRAEVPETGLIRYTVPKAEYDELTQQAQVIYHVLTVRVGARGDVLMREEPDKPEVIPSKTVADTTNVRRWYSSTGEVIDDLFRIYVVEKTEEMYDEIDRIGAYLAEELPEGKKHSLIGWFPEEIGAQAQLLIGDADANDLIGYDITAVMAEEYKDTYGDVATENTFASAYTPEHAMVVMLGFPLKEDAMPALSPDQLEKITHFEWYCLRAEAVENVSEEEFVEIVFKQLVIPQMEIEPALLLVLSEPLDVE